MKEDIKTLLREVDETVSAQLYLRGTGTKAQFIGLIAELGRESGFDIHKGDRALIHPSNVPAHLTLDPRDPVVATPVCPEDEIMFTNNQAHR